MSQLRRIDIFEDSFFAPKNYCFSHLDLSYALDVLNPNPFELFDTITDLIRFDPTPFSSSYKRMIQLRSRVENPEIQLQSLCDRVTALESSYDRLAKEKLKKLDRKYTWTAESKDRKYTWTAEINGDHKKKKKEVNLSKERKEKKGALKSYKWTAEIKRDPIARSYTFEASSGSAKEKKLKKKEKERKNDTRIVEIEDVSDHGAFVLKRAFAKRDNGKGKKKELSPLDAACMIQMNFRAYLIRRSQTLRGLRELAIAKTKLKELRGLFHNFAYRRHVSRDAEERQRFSEKIIVLLLTVDAIEGADVMVRSAKRSMVDELESMLEVIDPQPIAKSLSMRRRTFDMPTGGIQKEIAAGVARVAQLINEEDDNSTFEACL